LQISKIIEFEYGHRIPNHKSVCRGLHGHHGKLVISLEGDVVTKSGVSDEGMLMDFSEVKNIAMKQIHDRMDHGFIAYEKDEEALQAISRVAGNKTVVVPFIPTAENLAKWCFELLRPEYRSVYGNLLRLQSVEFFETPTSVARYTSSDFESDKLHFVASV
jgi:6-pyruvoyltetrahydropterin/6-carboxytetrahydropterin synthase